MIYNIVVKIPVIDTQTDGKIALRHFKGEVDLIIPVSDYPSDDKHISD